VTSADLYHDALVRLARAAAGAGRLEAPGGAGERDNPLCGDRAAVEVRLEGGRIAALGHRVRGCVLCQAAASLLGRAAPGAAPAEVTAARAALEAILRGEATAPPAGAWAEMALFQPVARVPSRRGCVLLPFDALADALARAEG
jgi:NifU-like protein involved in Fe-S cluster formation